MVYTKQNFTDGQLLKAEHLNNMEDGIVNTMPKIIDMRNYTYSNGLVESDTFNNAIAELFAAGGGENNSLHESTAFWDDVNTDRPLRIVLDLSPLGVPACLTSDGVLKSIVNGKPNTLSFSLRGKINGTIMTVNVYMEESLHTGNNGSSYVTEINVAIVAQ